MITHRPNCESTYKVSVEGGPSFYGGALNIATRASSIGPGTEMRLGGGPAEIIIKVYEDGRTDDGWLVAVGFGSETVL